MKESGEYGCETARLCQEGVQAGLSLNQIGTFVARVVLRTLNVRLREECKMSLHRNTIKLLALGISMLDQFELTKAILAAPFLVIAADESCRNGDKKYPIFIAFWDHVADAPWWGMFRVCRMKDKTAETQATLLVETIVDVLKYPRERVLYVLSDNTASVSGERGGCVTLVQRKLRGEDTTARLARGGGRGAGRGRGAARSRGARGAARGRGPVRGRGAARGQGRGRGSTGARGRGEYGGSSRAESQRGRGRGNRGRRLGNARGS